MRLSPTQEQRAYLTSIGASRATIPQPERYSGEPLFEADTSSPSQRTVTGGKSSIIRRLLIFFVAALLAVVVLAVAATVVNSTEEAPELADALPPIQLSGPIPSVIPPPIVRNEGGNEGKSTEANDQAKQLVVSHWSDALIAGSISYLRGELGEQRRELLKILGIGCGAIGVFCLLLLISGVIIMEKRLGKIAAHNQEKPEMTVLKKEDEAVPSPPTAAVIDEAAVNISMDPDPSWMAAVRFQPPPPPLPPAKLLATLVDQAANDPRIVHKPELPRGEWQLGVATHTGHVRRDNQDYCLGFAIAGGRQIVLVADGMGGLPHGREAAFHAVYGAAQYLIRNYARQSPAVPKATEAALKAIDSAEHRLSVVGEKYQIVDNRGGLRTTLIVVIGEKDRTTFAYIGDGGGYLMKTTGEIIKFLEPQKADGYALNVLAASLGPRREGEAVVGSLPRSVGDLMIVGTDGIMDRIDEETFPKGVLRDCINFSGNLQATAEAITEYLASQQDDLGYLCDDNLTLAIMGDGTSPRLPQGFWSPAANQEKNGDDRKNEQGRA